MSRKYKFHNKQGLYFISFAVVYWMDVFVREEYQNLMIDSLRYCQKEKGMEIYCWCLMPSHVHLIFRAKNNDPADVIRDLKTFTSKSIQKAIAENPRESRKEWMLWMFERAGNNTNNVTGRQFWQQHNQPIELWSPEVIEQKVNYIHQNPVKAGFVTEAWHWKLSSAQNFAGQKGIIDIEDL